MGLRRTRAFPYLIISSNREVAQLGSALGSGPRGRGFESRLLDHLKTLGLIQCIKPFFCTFIGVRVSYVLDIINYEKSLFSIVNDAYTRYAM